MMFLAVLDGSKRHYGPLARSSTHLGLQGWPSKGLVHGAVGGCLRAVNCYRRLTKGS